LFFSYLIIKKAENQEGANDTMGSVVKKRRKKIRKHKYKKLLAKMRQKKK